jgi:hypothetical protein
MNKKSKIFLRRQEIAIKIVNHVKGMKERCSVGCACLYYRPSDGSRCVIGAVLPEEMAKNAPTKSVRGLLSVTRGACKVLAVSRADFLPDVSVGQPRSHGERWSEALEVVQEAHDNSNNWPDPETSGSRKVDIAVQKALRAWLPEEMK